MRHNFEPPAICLVTDGRRTGSPEGDGIESLLGLIGSAARAGVDYIQIRESELDDRTLKDVVCQALALTNTTTTRIIVNDRVDVALAAGAAGVHLKETSISAERVRRLAPPQWLVGRSVHSSAEAVQVTARGALDYLIVGTVFETKSKEGQVPIGPDGLTETVQAVTVPVFAIGGVTVGNVRRVGQSGAVGFAAIAEFVDAGHQLDQVVKNLRQQFDKGRVSPL